MPPARTRPELTFAEHAVLALVQGGAHHGWAVVRELEADAEIGRIWSLSRQLTYRAIEQLETKGMLERSGTEPGRTRERTLLGLTPAGRSTTKKWLDEPVAHLREVRTELLVKLALRARAGLAPAPFLAAQRTVFAPIIGPLLGPLATPAPVDVWRREQARAVGRFLDALESSGADPAVHERPELRISARNQLRGEVSAVHHGEIMSTVKVVLPDGQQVTAAITREATEDLGFVVGDPAVVIVKSTEVLLAPG